MAAADTPSYIDYSSILASDFSPYVFANGLVTATNNPTDTPLDLSTPLSRVLFDVQEIDTHIHNLTSSSALSLLSHTKNETEAAGKILTEVDTQLGALNRGYQRLEEEVLLRWQEAEKARVAATKSWEILRLARAVSRCLALGRQLQAQMDELGSRGPTLSKTDDHRVLVRAANTLRSFRELFSLSQNGPDGDIGLQRVNVVKTLRLDLITPSETAIVGKSQQIIREFSMSSLTLSMTQTNTTQPSNTFAQTADTKSRITSAIHALYLLSPTTEPRNNVSLLLSALQSYLHSALTSSSASIARALSTLPTLDRTLLEVSARCQNILALETLLKSTPVPSHPSLSKPPSDFLSPLLSVLDSPPSLPSYFWRSLASSLAPRVTDILKRGGVSARTLRSNKDKVRDDIRECVLRGSRMPSNIQPSGRIERGDAQEVVVGNWEREAAVMVGSIVNVISRY